MRVSVVVPTKNRQHLFPLLYQCFCEQTYPDKEMLVLDDTTNASSYFPAVGDRRVRYVHATSGISLGDKRNTLVRLAGGEVIAQFDDDDYYAPDYLDFMVGALGDAHLVKLAGWYVYMAGTSVAATDFFGYWDTTAGAPQCYTLTPNGGVDTGGPLTVEDRNVYGYGFSYVFRKSVFEKVRFPGADFGEVLRMRDAGMGTKLVHDDQGLALHMIHITNCSRVFPQYRMPARWARNVFSSAFERYLSA